MKRILLVLAMVCFGIVVAVPVFGLNRYRVMIAPVQESTGKRTYDWINESLISAITASFAGNQLMDLQNQSAESDLVAELERNKLTVTANNQFVNLFDDNLIVKVGKLKAANYIIAGRYIAVGSKQLKVSLKLVNIETGKIAAALDLATTIDDYFKDEQTFVARFSVLAASALETDYKIFVDAAYLKALNYAQAGDQAGLDSLISKEIDPNTFTKKVIQVAANFYEANGVYDRAAAEFNKLLQIDPSDLNARKKRAVFTLGSRFDNPKLDMEDLQYCLDHGLRDGKILEALALAKLISGTTQGVRELLEEADKLGVPQDYWFFRPWMNLGIQTGDASLVITYATKLISLDSKEPQWYKDRGNAYKQKGDKISARKDFQTAVNLGMSSASQDMANLDK